MKEIPLLRGGVTLVDDQDFAVLSLHRWYTHTSHPSRPYVMRKEAGWAIFMHRVIMLPPPGLDVDHIDGDVLNNRRANLRICTRAQNNMNQRPHAASSRYKGVSFVKAQSRWYASIQVGGKTIGLGLYDAEDEAARAYDQAARRHFGKFARLNLATADAPNILASG